MVALVLKLQKRSSSLHSRCWYYLAARQIYLSVQETKFGPTARYKDRKMCLALVLAPETQFAKLFRSCLRQKQRSSIDDDTNIESGLEWREASIEEPTRIHANTRVQRSLSYVCLTHIYVRINTFLIQYSNNLFHLEFISLAFRRVKRFYFNLF